MARLKLILAYTGTHFQGWQIQNQGRTVQYCLEKALSTVCQKSIRVHASGRTDSGVHALGQVVHCDIPKDKGKLPWQKILNSLLPWDIAVIAAQWTSQDFHAQYSATYKEYSYHLWLNPDYVLPQAWPFVWQTGFLDYDVLVQAAKVFQGRHDFSAFQNVGTPVKSSIRTIHRISFQKGTWPEELVCKIIADGFLKQMARNIISGLVKVSKAKISISDLEDILASRDRKKAPATAPAKGLCLEKVFYDD